MLTMRCVFVVWLTHFIHILSWHNIVSHDIIQPDLSQCDVVGLTTAATLPTTGPTYDVAVDGYICTYATCESSYAHMIASSVTLVDVIISNCQMCKHYSNYVSNWQWVAHLHRVLKANLPIGHLHRHHRANLQEGIRPGWAHRHLCYHQVRNARPMQLCSRGHIIMIDRWSIYHPSPPTYNTNIDACKPICIHIYISRSLYLSLCIYSHTCTYIKLCIVYVYL